MIIEGFTTGVKEIIWVIKTKNIGRGGRAQV